VTSEINSKQVDGGRIDRYQQRLTNSTDADAYFIAFEGFAFREAWEKDTWVRRVSQCLEGKARKGNEWYYESTIWL
jgi:hypothetical protein